MGFIRPVSDELEFVFPFEAFCHVKKEAKVLSHSKVSRIGDPVKTFAFRIARKGSKLMEEGIVDPVRDADRTLTCIFLDLIRKSWGINYNSSCA